MSVFESESGQRGRGPPHYTFMLRILCKERVESNFLDYSVLLHLKAALSCGGQCDSVSQ